MFLIKDTIDYWRKNEARNMKVLQEKYLFFYADNQSKRKIKIALIEESFKNSSVSVVGKLIKITPTSF